MRIETKFNIGEKVYFVYEDWSDSKKWKVKGPLTIGQVRVTLTDSPGLEGEEIFDNYMPQKERDVGYMCVETGIGSGNVYQEDRLYYESHLAHSEADTLNAEMETPNA